jgi:3-hydroxyacyl-CoA dehydrogenase
MTKLSLREGVAVITLDNPPVNALGSALVRDLDARIAEAEAHAEVRCIVIIGDNGTFSGGADIREFGQPPAGGPTLRDVIARIEASRVPFVAALEGHALGGGLELAMACDYRIALAGTLLAQPEIKLGLIPGAGGTQRLPRLAGLEAALEIIETGELVAADRAKDLGLVDAFGAGDLLEGAVLAARECATLPRRRTRDMPMRGDATVLEVARVRAPHKDRGGLAAHAAIDAVAAGLRLPFDEAIAYERRLFEELRASDQSRSRIHIFFSEREASKVPGVQRVPDFRATTAGVIGGGTMGTGIAMALANAGISVTLVETSLDLVARARAKVQANYESSQKKGKFTESEVEQRLGNIHFSTWMEATAESDIVIEAVFEEMPLKQDIFRKLDHIVNADGLLATNTSTLDVDQIASVTRRPERVCGTHFFSPANVMKLLEIVRGEKTAPETIGQALAFARQIKKVAVVAGNCDGFIGNRMYAFYKREADFLLEEGATPQQVDRVMRDFGFAMGPFATFDLAGLDVSWRVRKRRLAEGKLTGRYSKLEDRLCEMGRLGQKTGAGFYRYFAGSRAPEIDPEVEKIIRAVAEEEGVARREIHDDEILKRCIYPLINEGANLLAEGIAIRPSDVDVVWVYGYGFPSFRGGPMHYADTIGAAKIVDEMRAFERAHGKQWTPSPLLVDMAEKSGSFASMHRAREWATR